MSASPLHNSERALLRLGLHAQRNRTGWQKHTVRGFVSGSLVRKGVAVESFKREDERTVEVICGRRIST